jgi:hypothetical protein
VVWRNCVIVGSYDPVTFAWQRNVTRRFGPEVATLGDMTMRGSIRYTRTLALFLAFSVAGCGSNTFRVERGELQRLAQLPPESRGQSVMVEQDLTSTDVAPQPAVSADTSIFIGPRIYVGGSATTRQPGGAGYSPRGGRGIPSMGTDAKDAAMVVLVLAATALVTVAVIEGNRFAGQVQLHPMHPVHLFGRDGGYTVMPLAAIDQSVVQWADHAVVRNTEGPWQELTRNSLTRDGWTYGVMVGAGNVRSRDRKIDNGPTTSIEIGHFFGQQLGILGFAQFAWRDNAAQGTVFEQRFGAQVQFMPLQASIFSLGGYAGLGFSRSFEDGERSYTNYTVAAPLGIQAQLELHTNIAITARLGAVRTQGETLREMLVGLTVY